jgi:N-acetylglucosamine kinase-like BadF-type ATPase
MNILIADSGASKTDWVLLGEGTPQFIQTEGLNPHLVTAAEFMNVLSKELKPNLSGKAISRIYFFGSGCGSPQKKKEVESYLKEIFEFAAVMVATDLDAAGMALFGEKDGIVCILGTGSSAGIFGNREIVKQMPSVGYPEGDEGSGSDIGKRILQLYKDQNLHTDLRKHLENKIEMDSDKLSLTFKKTKEAKLFASQVCKVMGTKSHYPQIQKILYEGFEAFINKVKTTFPEEIKTNEFGFVGSVASVYEAELRAVARQMDVELKTVIRSPIEHIALQFGK